MFEIIHNRIKIKLITKSENFEINKQQSKSISNGIHRSYTICNTSTFKQNEVLMDKPIYVGFALLELSKLQMYESYYYQLQPYSGQENTQWHYMETDSFVLSVKTKNIIDDLKKLGDIFDFSNLDENHELVSNKNEKFFWLF